MERTVAKVIAAIAVAAGLVTGCQPAAEAGTSARTDSASPEFESPTAVAPATVELPAPSLESPSVAETAPPAPESTCDATGNSVRTDFRHGTATLKVTSGDHDIAMLDRIADTTFYANFDPACPGGAQAEWTNASDEWLLTVLANLGPNQRLR